MKENKENEKLARMAKVLDNRLTVDREQKLDKTAGRLYIYPIGFRTESCTDKKPVVKIVTNVLDDDISLFQELKSEHRTALISLTALANTQMAIFGYGEDISFIDMMSICRADFFMEYFWNLTYNVMDSIQSGKSCEIWGKRMGRYLQGITQLYKNRVLISDQILNYRNMICEGLEEHNIKWWDPEIKNIGMDEYVEKKKQTRSFEDFIFDSQDDKDMLMDVFKKILLALKDYLKSYIDDVSSNEIPINKLKEKLDAFVLDCEVNLLSTDHLKEILPNSARTYKMNAHLIIKYLRKVSRKCDIKEYEAA